MGAGASAGKVVTDVDDLTKSRVLNQVSNWLDAQSPELWPAAIAAAAAAAPEHKKTSAAEDDAKKKQSSSAADMGRLGSTTGTCQNKPSYHDFYEDLYRHRSYRDRPGRNRVELYHSLKA